MSDRSMTWLCALLAVGALGLAVAHYVRYSVVEPAAIGAFCETALTDAWCAIRQTIIALLSEQRLGWLAIGLACLSLIFTLSILGWFTWFLACAGFVLYHAEFAAPALLIAGVALTRARTRTKNRRHSNHDPAHRQR